MHAIYKETVQHLAEIVGETEARSIANILFEDLLNIPRTLRLTNPETELSETQHQLYENALVRLRNHEPIQHVIGHVFFYGLKLHVNKHTLIPRPETEELVDLIVREHKGEKRKILDIGTGSGCIPIALAKNLPDSEIHSWDISEEALNLARQNAELNQITVTFRKVDILKFKAHELFDMIVSNPPYIPEIEQSQMAKNVTQYEPKNALFVPDQDPLLFYRKIGKYGLSALSKGGLLYLEIHERFGREITLLLEKLGYGEVSIKTDMQGKDRIARGKRL